MDRVAELKKLARREKALMKSVQHLTDRLFEVQARITELTIAELKNKTAPAIDTKDLLTTVDTCKLLGVSKSTLYRMRLYDGLPYVKVEGRRNVMYSRQEVEEYMKKPKR